MTGNTPSNRRNKLKNTEEQYNFVLPLRITSVVFWGLVLVGLIITVFLLQGKEKELQTRYQTNTILLANSMQMLLEKTQSVDAIKKILSVEFPRYQKQYSVAAVELKFGKNIIQQGIIPADSISYVQNLLVHGSAADNNPDKTNFFHKQISLIAYYPNLKVQVIAERKDMLITIGGLIFIFGLLLQSILRHMLTRPFRKLLDSAQKFARGDTSVRFDESTSDEFGFLSRFINKALDAIEQQQREVHRALARAKQSELPLFKEKELAEVTLYSITDAVITTDEKARINFMNPVAESILGWDKQEAKGRLICEIFQLVDEENCRAIENPLERLLSNKQIVEQKVDTALKDRNGHLISVELSVAAMKNQDGHIIGGVIVFQDISESRRMSRQLSYQASHDELTELFNRRVFEKRLEELLNDAWDEDNEHVLCYLDLDQFKVVNDTFGHMAGDELLRQLSIELSNSIRESDLLARLGGDEFGILLENCELQQAEKLAETIRKNIKNYRFVWEKRLFEVGVSIGVVAINKTSKKISDILSAADLACYAAKDSGRNRIHVYKPTDEELAKRHSEMHYVMRINNALKENAFTLFKQPVVSLFEKEKLSMHWEVLVRMNNDQGELVAPDAFIPAAERYNLMPKIDRMVIEKTFSAMSRGEFFRKGYEHRVVGINLSGDSLNDRFLEYIQQQTRKYNIKFNELCLEITETIAIANLSTANHFMDELKILGCQFALDDFGSGLSSFGYLKHLPVDFLKIDGSFVRDIASDEIDRAMVESINQIGHTMGLRTIAEWVEDKETLLELKKMGVDYSQGFYTGRPEPLQF